MENKKFIKVITLKKACPISRYQDLMTYSVLAYYDSKKNDFPESGKIASIIGLSTRGVDESLSRLIVLGMLDTSGVKFDPVWATVVKKAVPGEHWALTVANWTCYLRGPDSPLSSIAIACYSAILHRTISEATSTKKTKWSWGYLAKILRVDRRTVRQACERLREFNFLTWEPVGNYVRFLVRRNLNSAQLQFLADKKVIAKTPQEITSGFLEDFAPAIAPTFIVDETKFNVLDCNDMRIYLGLKAKYHTQLDTIRREIFGLFNEDEKKVYSFFVNVRSKLPQDCKWEDFEKVVIDIKSGITTI